MHVTYYKCTKFESLDINERTDIAIQLHLLLVLPL